MLKKRVSLVFMVVILLFTLSVAAIAPCAVFSNAVQAFDPLVFDGIETGPAPTSISSFYFNAMSQNGTTTANICDDGWGGKKSGDKYLSMEQSNYTAAWQGGGFVYAPSSVSLTGTQTFEASVISEAKGAMTVMMTTDAGETFHLITLDNSTVYTNGWQTTRGTNIGGSWHKIAITFYPEEKKSDIYLDGTLVEEGASDTNGKYLTKAFSKITKLEFKTQSGSPSPFSAKYGIDNVRLYAGAYDPSVDVVALPTDKLDGVEIDNTARTIGLNNESILRQSFDAVLSSFDYTVYRNNRVHTGNLEAGDQVVFLSPSGDVYCTYSVISLKYITVNEFDTLTLGTNQMPSEWEAVNIKGALSTHLSDGLGGKPADDRIFTFEVSNYTGGAPSEPGIAFTNVTPVTDLQTFEMDVYLDRLGGQVYFIPFSSDNKSNYAINFDATGRLCYNQWGIYKGTYVPNRWYKVAFTYDPVTKKAKFYLNGELVAEDVSLTNELLDIKKIKIAYIHPYSNSDSVNAKLHVDNVRWYRGAYDCADDIVTVSSDAYVIDADTNTIGISKDFCDFTDFTDNIVSNGEPVVYTDATLSEENNSFVDVGNYVLFCSPSGEVFKLFEVVKIKDPGKPFDDLTFDEMQTGTVTGNISDFYFDAMSQNGTTTANICDDGWGGKKSGDKYLALEQSNYTSAWQGGGFVYKPSEPTLTGTQTFEASVASETKGAMTVIMTTDAGETFHLISLEGDKLYTNGWQTQRETNTSGSWHKIAITFYPEDGKSDIYLDGVLVEKNAAGTAYLTKAFSKITKLEFKTQSGSPSPFSAKFGIDNVKLYRGVYDNTKDAIVLSGNSEIAVDHEKRTIGLQDSVVPRANFDQAFDGLDYTIYRGGAVNQGDVAVGDMVIVTSESGEVVLTYTVVSTTGIGAIALTRNDGTVTASVDLSAEEPIHAVLVLAAYEGGRMMAIVTEAAENISGQHSLSCELPIVEGQTVKAMLIDGFSTLKPLTNSKTE